MNLKKIVLVIFICSIWANVVNAQEKCVRGNMCYGLFVEFFWTLNHLYYCTITNKIPVVYWANNFAYYDPRGYNGSTNGWEYYFEPVSDLSYTPGDKLHTQSYYPATNGFCAFCWYCQYVSNKHLLSADEQKSLICVLDHEKVYLSKHFANQTNNKDYPIKHHPYSKSFREFIRKNILDKYVRIKSPARDIVNTFYDNNMRNKTTIGIHLRGAFITNYEVLDVPIDYIFEQANKYAGDNVQFFVATDQLPLLEEAKKKLHGQVIFYDCQRFASTSSPDPKRKLTPQAGQDVLVEMLLLSQCNHLIHTLSNVSTAALYFNPDLEHTAIY